MYNKNQNYYQVIIPHGSCKEPFLYHILFIPGSSAQYGGSWPFKVFPPVVHIYSGRHPVKLSEDIPRILGDFILLTQSGSPVFYPESRTVVWEEFRILLNSNHLLIGIYILLE